MRSLVLVLLVTACGRFGFDESATADGAAGVCPSGTTEIEAGSPVCVERVERGTKTWVASSAACTTLGRRLCTDVEWLQACTNASGLVDMANDNSPNWEWVADEAGGFAKKRGAGLCTDTSEHEIAAGDYDFRCCTARQ